MSQISVNQLTIYPVKSLRGIAVDSLNLGVEGPKFDRQWMVVDKKGKFLTQRRLPRMTLVSTRLDNSELWLSSKDQKVINIPAGGGSEINVSVWRDTLIARDCGDEAADWLSRVLEIECRIVFMPKGNERNSPENDPDFPAQLAFADAYPLLLTANESLHDFNSYLSQAVTMERFRPNIVVSGATAYAEDTWQKVAIGGLEFSLASPCTRCIVPAINPDSADKEQEVLDVLNQTRRFGTETRFGQNLTYAAEGRISVGDAVEVIT